MNIDAMDDEDLEALEDYIRLIRKAREARREGRIADALMFEGVAELAYQRLPEDIRW